MKKTLFSIILTALLAVAASAQSTPTNFTQDSNQFCTFQKYSGNPVINRFSCGVIPTDQTNLDGSQAFQSFYVDLTPNDGNTGGTFVGQIWLNKTTLVDFTGTYFGTIAPFPAQTVATITGLSGSWDTGSVTSTFGTHNVGCGRNCTRVKTYLRSGSGVE